MGIRNVRKNQIGVITDANRRAIERLPAEEADAIRVALEPLRKRLKAAPFNV
jgi:hypothetical protein